VLGPARECLVQVQRVKWLKTIGDHKVPDDGAVIGRLAIPLAGDRVGVDCEGIIHRLDPRPAEVFRRWTRRCRGHHPTIRIPELRIGA
jgi:hypothetical protein